MKFNLKVAALLAGGVLFGGGMAFGQWKTGSAQNDLTSRLTSAESGILLSNSKETATGQEYAGSDQKLATIYADVARNPASSRYAAGYAVGDYFGDASALDKRTTVVVRLLQLQTAQSARLIEQNEQIIQLLKQQKAK